MLILALREIKAYLRDRGDLAFSLLLPVVTFALIYGAFGGQETFHGNAYIVNEDAGAYSQALLNTLKDNDSLDIHLLSARDADAKLDRSDITLVMFIPADFSSNLEAGQPAQVTFKQRGNGGQEGQIVAGIESGVLSDMDMAFQVRAQVSQALDGRGISAQMITATVQQMLVEEASSPLVTLNEEVVGGEVDPVESFLPGIVTMYVLFAITISARAIVEERKNGTLERLLTTRLTTGELFGGKFLASIGRGFVQTLILLVLSYIVFGLFTPLSFIEVLLFSLLFAAAGSAVGLLIASLARTPDSANWIAVFFTMGSVMLGGTFFDISEGTVMYTLSRFSINTYANEAFKTLIAGNGSLADIGVPLAVMAGVTVVALLVSRLLFKPVSAKR
jgi:ABC-type Na+ efflux pump permease subunit